jgi:hypothetical protein
MEKEVRIRQGPGSQYTTILSTKPRYTDWMIRKAIKSELHLNNMIMECGLYLG